MEPRIDERGSFAGVGNALKKVFSAPLQLAVIVRLLPKSLVTIKSNKVVQRNN